MASPSHLATIANQNGRIVSSEIAAEKNQALLVTTVGPTTFFTTPKGPVTEYLLNAYLTCTVVGGAGTYALTVTYTDADLGTAKTLPMATSPVVTATSVTPANANMIRCKANTAVQFTVTVTATTTAAGNAYLRLIRTK